MSSIDLSGALWRKSSYSNGQANCVEVAAMSGRKDDRSCPRQHNARFPRLDLCCTRMAAIH